MARLGGEPFRIRPRLINVLSSELFPSDSLDVVFFRNTLVYMPQTQKDRAIDRITHTLRPGGYLFLASPEIPTVRHPLLEVLERRGGFFFRRLSREKAAAKAPVRTEQPTAKREKRRVAEAESLPSSIGDAELRRGLALASTWRGTPGSARRRAGADRVPRRPP